MNLNNLFNQNRLDQYAAYLKSTSLSDASIQRKLSSLSSFQKFLIKNNLINPSPTPSLDRAGTQQINFAPLSRGAVRRTEGFNLFSKIFKKRKFNKLSNFQLDKLKSNFILRYVAVFSLLVIGLGLGFTLYRQAFTQSKKNFAYTTASNPVVANRQLSFQGRLTDSSGNPITSSTTILFKLYDTETVGSGSSLYTSATGNSQTVTPDENGIFSVVIGKTHGTEIPDSVFTQNSAVYLEITAGGEVMSPRQPIATVAYALNSESLQGLPPSASGLKNTVLVIDELGNINLGETSPTIKSTSGTMGIEAQAVLIKATDGSGGNIEINPDANGIIKLTTEGSGSTLVGGFINATNANLATGNLFNATINNTNRGYNFINFSNYNVGTTQLTSRFSVDAYGNTNVGGTLSTTNLAVGSSSLVSNLNADLLDGQHASAFIGVGQTSSFVYSASNGLSLASNTFKLGGLLTQNTDIGLSGFSLSFSDGGSTLVTFSSAGNTFYNPTTFTSSGDVSMAYNLNFTNSSGSNINTAGPLAINAGEVFGSSNLTLKTYNAGKIIFDSANLWTDGTNFGIGTTNPTNKLTVAGNGNITGNLTIGSSLVSVGSTNIVTNLNADLLDGYHASTFLGVGSTGNFISNLSGVGISISGSGIGRTLTNTGLVGVTNSTLTRVGSNGTYTVGLNLGNANNWTGAQNFASNVGIGTTAPNHKLDVRGSLGFLNNFWSNVYFDSSWKMVSDGYGYSSTMNNADGVLYFGRTPTSIVTGGTTSIYNYAQVNPNGQYIFNYNVGIGTTNPTSKLTVAGNGSFSTNLNVGGTLTLPQGASNGYILTSDASGNAKWLANTGIGTTYAAGVGLSLSSSNVFSLNLASANTWTGLQTFNATGAPFAVGSSNVVTNLNANYLNGLTSSAFVGIGQTGNFITTISVGASGLSISGSGIGRTLTNTGLVGVTNSTLTRVGSNGTYTVGLNLGNANNWTGAQNFASSVGIGTTAPGYNLDVQNNGAATIRIYDTSATRDTKLRLSTGGGNWDLYPTVGTGSGFNIKDPSNNVVFTALGGGNVGIGNTNPTSKLTVAGNGNFTTSLSVGTSLYIGSIGITTDNNKVLTNTNGVVQYIDTSSWDKSSADDYSSWTLQANGANGTNIGNTSVVNFIGGSNVSLSKTGNSITINSTNSTYTASNGLSLVGSDFRLGGLLSQNTDIGLSGFSLSFSDGGSTLVTFSSAGNTFYNPTTFTSSGDVSMAYDLNFTNSTASYIRAAAPLYIQTESPYANLDLNLTAANAGQIYLNSDAQLTKNLTVGGTFVSVGSTNLVTNLNSDLLDGQHSSAFVGIGQTGNFITTISVGASGLSISGSGIGRTLTNTGLVGVTNSTLTRIGSNGTYTVGLNLGNANNWTAAQTFANTSIGGTLTMTGTNVGTGTTALFIASNGTVTKRALGSMAFDSGTYDNYNHWKLTTNGAGSTNVLTGNTVNFVSGIGVSLVQSGSTITINNTGTGTTYAAGVGLSLSSSNVFSLNLASANTWTGLQTFNASGAPFAVGSNTKVTNLNADLLDGIDSTSFVGVGQTGSLPYVNNATNGTLTRSGTGPYTLGLNLGNANTWTALQNFSVGATASNLSVTNNAYVGNLNINNSWAKISLTNTSNTDLTYTHWGNQVFLIDADNNDGTARYFSFGIGSTAGSGSTELMRISSSGNVGIGTTNPTSKLHVIGNGNITGNLTIGGTFVSVGSTNTVTNLSADLLDGYHASSFLNIGSTGNLPYVNNATNGTLTRSGTGPYTLGLNLGNANTWTALQTFNSGITVGNTLTATNSIIGSKNITSFGLTTTNVGSSSNMWTKVGSFRLNSQYANIQGFIQFTGGATGGSPAIRGQVYFRVKQQNVMGGVPYFELETNSNNTVITKNDFQLITVQNDATVTIAELWIRIPTTWETLSFNPTLIQGTPSDITWFETQGISTTTPVGTGTTIYAINSNGNFNNLSIGGTFLSVGSTNLVTNLNSDLLDGQHASAFVGIGQTGNFITTISVGASGLSISGSGIGRTLTNTGLVGVTNSTLTRVGSNGTYTVGLNLANANTWTAKQTFNAGIGVSGIATFADNVGIGTTNPLSKLQVSGNSIFGNAITATSAHNSNLINILSGSNASGNTNGISFWEDTASAMKIGYDGSGSGAANALKIYDFGNNPLVTFQNGGNVGIGTTNPTQKLEIIGNALISGNVGIGTTNPTQKLHIKDASSYAAIGLEGGNTGDTNWLLMSGYPIAGDFSVREAGIQTSLTIKKTTGNIGIGTTNPTNKLDVIGTAQVIGTGAFTANSATANNKVISIRNTGGTERFYFNYNNNTARLTLFNNIGLSDNMTWDSAGNIGIGTTNPTSKLHVAGNGNITGNLTIGGTFVSVGSTNTVTNLSADLLDGYHASSFLNIGNTGNLPYVNNATNGTLTRSGSGPYTLGLNLGNANTWTALQTFTNGIGVSGTANFTNNINLAANKQFIFGNSGVGGTPGGFEWQLTNDTASMYASEVSADQTDYVFKMSDNAASDRFVFWIDEWQGQAYDKYPLVMAGDYASFFGNKVYINESTGNVGIGTGGAASYKLQVIGDASISTNLNVGGTLTMTGTNVGTGTTALFIASNGTVTKRALGSMAFDNGTYDNYNNWKLTTNGAGSTNVLSGNTVNFANGIGVSLVQSGSTITINNTGTGTTYAAGVGLSLSSSNVFSVDYDSTLDLASNKIGLNLGNANTWTATQTFNAGNALNVGGTAVFNNLVGIGTASPTEKLTLGTGLFKINKANSVDNDSPSITTFSDDDFAYNGLYLSHYGLGFHDTNTTPGQTGAYMSGYFGLDFFTTGTNRLNINTSGNVGIGTTNPTSKLHLDSMGNTNAIAIKINGTDLYKRDIFFTESGDSTNYGGVIRYDSQSDILQMFTLEGGTEVPGISIKRSSGNVGIGTTNPTSKLHVIGNGNITGNLTIGGTFVSVGSTNTVTNLSADLLDGYHASSFLNIGNTGNLPYVNNATNGTLTRSGSGPYTLGLNLGNANTWTALQTFTNGIGVSGTANLTNALNVGGTAYFASLVGIGTTSPTDNLTIQGSYTSTSIKLYGGGAATENAEFIYNSNGSNSLDIRTNYASSGNIITLSPGASTAMTLLGSGNVGIGTTNPQSPLEIRSGTNARLTINRQGSWGSSPSDIKFNTNDAGANYWLLGMKANNTNDFYLNQDGTDFITVKTSGNVGIGTTNPGDKLTVVATSGTGIRSTVANSSGNFGVLGNASGVYGALGYNDGNHPWSLYGNSDAYISGNVGIGTTAPGSKLTVAGNGNFTTSLSVGTSLYIGSIGITTDNNKVLTNTNGVVQYIDTSSWDKSSADDYSSWTLQANGANGTNIGNTAVVNFIAGTNISLSKTGNAITINNSAAAYTASNGLSLVGQDFRLGGLLSQNTDIGLSGFSLSFSDGGSTLVTFSSAGNTFYNPTTFTSSGDVSMAYNLNFTNSSGSNINTAGPLAINAGEVFGSSNLTLKTYNAGKIIFDSANLWTDGTNFGIGTTAPTNKLTVAGNGNITGNLTIGSSLVSVGSTNIVTNLNSDLLDGQHSSAFVGVGQTGNFITTISVGASGLSISGSGIGRTLTNTGLVGVTNSTLTRVGSNGTYTVGLNLGSANTWTALQNLSAGATISNLSIGGTFLSVGSTNTVTNLSADLLDGQHGSYFVNIGQTGNFITNLTAGTDISITGSGIGRTINDTSTLATVTGRGASTSTLLSLLGGAYFGTAGSTQGIWKANGTVGIGTTAPSESLEIVGNAKLSGSIYAQKFYDQDNSLYALDSANASTTNSSLSLTTSGSIRFNYKDDGTHIVSSSAAKIQNLTNGLLLGVSSSTTGTVTGWDNNLFLATSGDIGIGTTDSESSKLHIYDGVKSARINLQTADVRSFITNGYDYLSFVIGNGELYLNRATGNVGIGTTNTNPSHKLDVIGNAVFSGNVGIGTTAPGTKLTVMGSIEAIGVGSTNVVISNNQAGALDVIKGYDASSDVILMGIGVSGIANTSMIGDYDISSGSFVGMRRTESYKADFGYYYNWNGAANNLNAGMEVRDGLYLDFVLDGSKFMRLNTSGYLGIGTTNPLTKLQVNVGTDMNLAIRNGNYDPAATLIQSMNNAGTVITPMELRASKFSIMDGNVGIGTTAPTSILNILGDNPVLTIQRTGAATAEGIRFLDNVGSSGYFVGIEAVTENALVFRAASNTSNERMRLTQAGNLGIGTTNPTDKLEISGSASGIKFSGTGGHIIQTIDSTALTLQASDTNHYFKIDNTVNTMTLREYGNIHFNTGTSSGIDMAIIGSSGNVGIGTTNPGSKLEVDGVISLSNIAGNLYNNTAQSSYDKLRVWNSSSYTIGMASAQTLGYLNDYAMTFTMSADTDRGWLWRDSSDATSDGAMSLTTNGRLYVKSTAAFANKIGVGTTDPITNLHLADSGIALCSGAACSTTSLGRSIQIETDANYGSYYTSHTGSLIYSTMDSAGWGSSQLEVRHSTNWGTYTTAPDMVIGTYVGIGIANPDTKLRVWGGTIAVTGSDTNGTMSMYTSAAYGYIGIDGKSNAIRITPTTGYVTMVGGHGDLAENYLLNGTALRGSLVSIGSTNPSTAVTSSKKSQSLLGVISTAPGAVMDVDGGFQIGSDTKLVYQDEKAPIALTGAVPILVASDNGQINLSDSINASEISGFGSKATTAGQIVGKALEAFNPTDSACITVDSIESIVWPDDDGKNSLHPCYKLPNGTYVGKIMAFISASWYDPDVNLTATGDVNVDYNISDSVLASLGYNDSKNEIETATYKLTDSTGKIVDRLGQFSEIAAAKIKTGLLSATNIIADNIIVKNLRSEKLTSEELLSPKANIDQLTAIDIQTTSITTDELKSDKLTSREATISTLYADNIISKEGSFGDLMAQKVSAVRDELKKLIEDQESSSSAITGTSIASQTSDWRMNIASDSAQITGDLAITNNLVIGAKLLVNGDTQLANAFITGTFSAGEISIKDNFIETTNTALYIQPSNTGSIHMMGETLVIAENGEVQINGNLAVSGSLFANLITANEVQTQKLTAVEINSDQVKIATDSAQIIIADSGFAALATSSANLTSNATAGTATLPIGKTEIIINNNKITNNSMVYITPVGSTKNQVPYIKAKVISESESYFTIALDNPLDQDIEINWWIIN